MKQSIGLITFEMFIGCDVEQSHLLVARKSCSQDNFVCILEQDRKWQKRIAFTPSMTPRELKEETASDFFYWP